MKLRLQLSHGEQKKDYEFSVPRITIGRNPASEIVLELESSSSVVSHDHARIDLPPSGATVTDLDSRNGTYLNGAKVTGTVPLRNHDVIRLGATGPELKVRLVDISPATALLATGTTVKSKSPDKKTQVEPSKTRMMVLNVLKLHRDGQEKSTQRFVAVSAAIGGVMLLLLLLLWWGIARFASSDKRHDEHELTLASYKKEVDSLPARWEQIEIEQAKNRQTIFEEDAEIRERIRKLNQALKDNRDKQGQDHERIADLEERNEAIRKQLVSSEPKLKAPPSPGLQVTLGPGDKLALFHRNKHKYEGPFVFEGMTANDLFLYGQIIDKKQRMTFAWRDIQAIETKNGIFVVDPQTGILTDALAYFEFVPGTGEFRRMAKRPPYNLCQDAVLEAPAAGFVHVLVTNGPGGQLCLGIPNGQDRQTLPASRIRAIETARGVWSYDIVSQDFTYKSQQQLASDRQQIRDAARRAEEERRYHRSLEVYEAGSRRLEAIGGSRVRWVW